MTYSFTIHPLCQLKIYGSNYLVANKPTNEYNELMKINVPHVAKLANLTLADEEIKKFETQLSSVLDYIKKLSEVDTKNVEPTSQVTGLENVTREDTISPSLPQEKVLSSAKSKHNGFFVVKGIIN